MLKDIWVFIQVLLVLVGIVAFSILLPILAYVFVVGFLLTLAWAIAKNSNDQSDEDNK